MKWDVHEIMKANADSALKAAKQEAGSDSGNVSQMFSMMFTKTMSLSIFKRMEELSERIDQIETKGVSFRGLHNKSETYSRGDLVSYKGAIYHCVTDCYGVAPYGLDDKGKSFTSPQWQLAVSKGRDAR